MRMEFDLEVIGHGLLQEACDGLSVFLNTHVLAGGNTVTIMPPQNPGGDGVWGLQISITIDDRPKKTFLKPD